MDLTTFTDLFVGSPYKPLNRHRKTVLEALGLLNRQLQSQLSVPSKWQGRPQWLAEFSGLIEKHERAVMVCLYQPSLTAQPKDRILTMLQTQSNLAHLIGRLAERFSYRPMQLTPDMKNTLILLCQNFGKAVYQLRQGIIELDSLKTGLKKPHGQSMTEIHEKLIDCIDAIKGNGQALREQAFLQEKSVSQLDIAILLLTLDDMEDLALWMKTMVIQMQPK